MDSAALWERIWAELSRATLDRKSGFRTLALATADEDGPDARMLVLRRVDPITATLGFNSDRRSPKIALLLADPRVAILGYDAAARLQIRMRGVAQVHTQDEFAREAWDQAQLLSRRCYLAPHPPSSPSSAPSGNLPPDLADREPTAEEAEPGFVNFTAIRVVLHQIELYDLSFIGHTRIRWKQDASGWHPEWLHP